MDTPPAATRHLAVGRFGERLALVLLWLKGYRLRHRNWRAGRLELDLVMERRGTLVFVEVKARSDRGWGGPAAAVDAEKQANLVRAASAYLGRFGLWERPCRFDVVLVQRRDGRFGWRVRHLRDAIRPDLGRRM